MVEIICKDESCNVISDCLEIDQEEKESSTKLFRVFRFFRGLKNAAISTTKYTKYTKCNVESKWQELFTNSWLKKHASIHLYSSVVTQPAARE